MKRCCLLCLLLASPIILGCDQQSRSNVTQTEPQPVIPNQAEAVKAHVQQYIDRLLGGDQSVKQGLLGLDGVDFNTLDSIQITSALPTYLPDGRKVDNMFRVVMNVKGYDALKRRTIEKNIDRDVWLREGQWNIMGSNL